MLGSAISADESTEGNVGVSASVSLTVNAESIELVLSDKVVEESDLLLRLSLDGET